MPPRLSPRKILLTFFIIVGIMVLVGTKYNLSNLVNRSKSSFSNNDNKLRINDIEDVLTESEENKNENENYFDDVKKSNRRPTPEKPWFLTGGTLYPEKSKGPLRLFPDQADGDRIYDQLMYVPEDYEGNDSPEKLILLYNGFGGWGQNTGTTAFRQCPVSRCFLTADRNKVSSADGIIFKDRVTYPGTSLRSMKQVWILYHLECPYHTQTIKIPESINWTSTYRRDSDIVAPYEYWMYYDPQVKQKIQEKNYAANKTKKVAWFVSNCGARNNRLQYAEELSKYIEVDIYGYCGNFKCPRSEDGKCFNLLKTDYKFYLAFENSNCQDYVTEKFFVNGLNYDILPIVMGARPEEYQKIAPEGSYIHVEEFSGPEDLAAYLHRLDKDDTLYNAYFRWKGTGQLINTYFWCRVCAMLHAPLTSRNYEDVNDWWRGPGICTAKSWRNTEFV